MFRKYVNFSTVTKFIKNYFGVFIRFDEKENISGFQQLKTSVQKGIRNKITEQFPYIENCINEVLPKKDPFRLMKW